MTQLELSHEVGVTETSIQNWERSRGGLEAIERVVRLCKALECNVEDLIEYILQDNTTSTNELSKWLEDENNEQPLKGWEKPDAFFEGTRFSGRISKLLDFGQEEDQVILSLDFPQNPAQKKMAIDVKLSPLPNQTHLPSHLRLEILTASGKTLQKIEPNIEDSLIQTSLKISKKTKFSIKVSLKQKTIIENFES
jgi:DNA-binding Xre family transcriptional regulator